MGHVSYFRSGTRPIRTVAETFRTLRLIRCAGPRPLPGAQYRSHPLADSAQDVCLAQVVVSVEGHERAYRLRAHHSAGAVCAADQEINSSESVVETPYWR